MKYINLSPGDVLVLYGAILSLGSAIGLGLVDLALLQSAPKPEIFERLAEPPAIAQRD